MTWLGKLGSVRSITDLGDELSKFMPRRQVGRVASCWGQIDVLSDLAFPALGGFGS